MKRHVLDRLLFILIICATIFLANKYLLAAQPTTAEPEQNQQVQGGLVPRFIDFDTGAATVRSGASHQDSIPDLPPYVLLPDTGFPLTLVNFTIPPDFATGGDFVARILWSTTSTPPCFFVLRTELVGYGPGHSAALFDPYWSESPTPSDEHIIQVDQSYSTFEQFVTFQGTDGFPAYPGDIMTVSLLRDAGDANDTCTNSITIRSISLTYQGLTTYLPFTVR